MDDKSCEMGLALAKYVTVSRQVGAISIFSCPCPTLAENKYFDSFLSEIGFDFDR